VSGDRYARPVPGSAAGRHPGAAIVGVSWAANALFAATALPVALGVTALDDLAAATALGLFVVSLGVWLAAFGLGIARSARGDDVVVASLFFLQGSAPKLVRVHLFGSVGVSVVIAAATAATDPFGVLVPMLPLALAGLWGARHGVFPPRPARPGRPGGPDARSARAERRARGRAGE
jgi:hypothetical protein